MSGLRERNKLEKRRRIIDATLSLLAEKGFELATTREIAERAGVAVGTLFLYAHDKLDLFLMSITEDLDPLTEAAFQAIDKHAPLLDQLGDFFGRRFEFWARWPELSRVATHEMAASYTPSQSSPEMTRGIKRRAQTLAKLVEMLRRAQGVGILKPDADVDGLALIILYIYLAELRFWLSADRPRPGDAVRKMKRLSAVALSGAIL